MASSTPAPLLHQADHISKLATELLLMIVSNIEDATTAHIFCLGTSSRIRRDTSRAYGRRWLARRAHVLTPHGLQLLMTFLKDETWSPYLQKLTLVLATPIPREQRGASVRNPDVLHKLEMDIEYTWQSGAMMMLMAKVFEYLRASKTSVRLVNTSTYQSFTPAYGTQRIFEETGTQLSVQVRAGLEQQALTSFTQALTLARYYPEEIRVIFHLPSMSHQLLQPLSSPLFQAKFATAFQNVARAFIAFSGVEMSATSQSYETYLGRALSYMPNLQGLRIVHRPTDTITRRRIEWQQVCAQGVELKKLRNLMLNGVHLNERATLSWLKDISLLEKLDLTTVSILGDWVRFAQALEAETNIQCLSIENVRHRLLRPTPHKDPPLYWTADGYRELYKAIHMQRTKVDALFRPNPSDMTVLLRDDYRVQGAVIKAVAYRG